MMQESATDARKGVNINQQRIDIVIPVSAIRRKLPEIGAEDPSKMAFALVLKSGKKINVKKIELENDSKITKITKERIKQHEIMMASEKQRIKEDVMTRVQGHDDEDKEDEIE